MATYTPYKYESTLGPAPIWDSYDSQWVNRRGNPTMSAEEYAAQGRADQTSQFRNYSQYQFKGLFDMINSMPKNPNPLSGFSQAPMYSPLDRGNYESDNAFQDARFGNINSYLGSLGAFLGNMGGGDAGIAQAAAQRAAHRASMPTIGMSQPMGTPQPMGMPQMGGSPALSGFGGGGGRLVGKGWGSHPAFKGLLAGGGE